MNARCTCVVCLDDLFEGRDTNPIYATPCGHIFHYPCITQWIHSTTASYSNTCPQCRTNITIQSLIKLNIHVEASSRRIVTRSVSRKSQAEVEVIADNPLYIAKEVENNTLRLENTTLKSELSKVQNELKNERERNTILRSDLRIIDIINLDAENENTNEGRADTSTILIDLS